MSRIPRNATMLRFETVPRPGFEEKRTGTARKSEYGEWVGTFDDEPKKLYRFFVSHLRDDEMYKIKITAKEEVAR